MTSTTAAPFTVSNILNAAKPTQSQIESWVHPDDLYMWELQPYIDKYNGHWSSYRLHYEAACRGSRISVERMEYMITAMAAVRLRASGNGEKLDNRFAFHYDKGLHWYGRS